jgi:hypothetical protein
MSKVQTSLSYHIVVGDIRQDYQNPEGMMVHTKKFQRVVFALCRILNDRRAVRTS